MGRPAITNYAPLILCAIAVLALGSSPTLAGAGEATELRLVTLQSSHKDSGLLDDRSSPENFSTEGAPDDATGLVFRALDAQGDPLTGVSFDVRVDKSLGLDGRPISKVTLGEEYPMVSEESLYIASPKGADASFMVEVYARVPSGSPSVANQGWMSDRASELDAVPIGQLSLPGAHDAGSYAINDRSPTSPDAPGAIQLVELANTDLVAHWSRAQGASMEQQLMAGVRYFDLRVSVDGEGTMRVTHSLFSEPIEAVIDTVVKFNKAHPDELVLLDFQALSDDKNEALDEQHLTELLDQLNALPLLPPTLDGAEGARITYGQAREAKKTVIVFMKDDQLSDAGAFFESNPSCWSRDTYLVSVWFNKSAQADLLRALDAAVADQSGRRPEQLWVLQAQRTFDTSVYTAWEELEAALSLELGGLETWAAEDAEAIKERMSGDWADADLNIVMVDWAVANGVVEATIGRNPGD